MKALICPLLDLAGNLGVFQQIDSLRRSFVMGKILTISGSSISVTIERLPKNRLRRLALPDHSERSNQERINWINS